MAIKMVREPSETPNINNIDDIVPMRYAYGNQNGYVIGKGNEISNTVNGLNFTVNSGRLVLQGVECDIDAVGVTITIDNIATTRYYVVYLQVNLGTNTASILSSYDTATYPSIDEGDDLTENTTGVARLPLYRFTATSGIISDVNKVVENIKYINPSVTVDNSKKVNNLEIKKDENNKLKIGDDQIILYKKNLFNNENGATSIDLSSLSSGQHTLELTFRVTENAIVKAYYCKKIKIYKNQEMEFNFQELDLGEEYFHTGVTPGDLYVNFSFIKCSFNNNMLTILQRHETFDSTSDSNWDLRQTGLISTKYYKITNIDEVIE